MSETQVKATFKLELNLAFFLLLSIHLEFFHLLQIDIHWARECKCD